MRPEQHTIEVDDTTNGNDVRMGIHEESFAHVMDMLTGIYEDPELAPGRELSTNAYDSHIAAGQTRPIEVTVGRQGSQLSLPVLKIQDWGLGMDEQDIANTYSQYGASSKRGSNAEVGMFGIGCKSPLAYTDQFTLVCVKDGNKIIVSISRDDEGGGTMTVMDAGATDEPNGVLAEIPVHSGNGMLDKLEHFFAFWPRGTVLLNGEEPVPYDEWESAVAITDEITVVDVDDFGGDVNSDFVVMGNVPYPAQFGLYDRRTYRYGSGSSGKVMVVKVPIGALSIPPAREALKDTKRTKDTLDKIKGDFARAARGIVEREVAAANDHGEALQAFVKTCNALPEASRPAATSLTYKGDTLPEWDEVFGSRALSSAGYKYSTGKYKPSLENVAEGIWVTNFANENFTGSQREKLRLYLEAKGWTDPSRRALYLLPTTKIQHDKWVPTSQRIDWLDVKKWKVPGGTVATGIGTKVITGSYWTHLKIDHPDRTHGNYVHEMAADHLPKQSLYWVQAGKHEGKQWSNLIGRYDHEATMVVLSANRVDKFCRDFPKAVEVQKAIREKVEAKLSATEDDTVYALHMDYSLAEDLEPLRGLADSVEDPDLKRAIELSVLREDLSAELNQIEEEQRKWNVKVPDKQDPALDRADKRYPLLRTLYTYGTLPMEDVLIYINAAYAARKEAN